MLLEFRFPSKESLKKEKQILINNKRQISTTGKFLPGMRIF